MENSVQEASASMVEPLFGSNVPVRMRNTGQALYVIDMPTFDPREEVCMYRYNAVYSVNGVLNFGMYWEDELEPYCS